MIVVFVIDRECWEVWLFDVAGVRLVLRKISQRIYVLILIFGLHIIDFTQIARFLESLFYFTHNIRFVCFERFLLCVGFIIWCIMTCILRGTCILQLIQCIHSDI